MLRKEKGNLNNIPDDVRKSLEVLDKVLDEFQYDDTTYSQKTRSRNNSPDAVKKEINNAPEDISKSLEILDSVLDEFQDQNKVRRRNKSNSPKSNKRYEDVRRSLEVLDNVLAEFDDCCDSWETPQFNGIHYSTSTPSSQSAFEQKNGFEKNISLVSESNFFHNASPEGATSQLYTKAQEQQKVNSPPPIPKRSPGTKLSERNSIVFEFPNEFTSLDSCEFSCTDPKNASLSLPIQVDVISHLSLDSDATQTNDDVFTAKNDLDLLRCVACGCALKDSEMEDKDSSVSPFTQRRQMFEDKIAEASLKPVFLNKKVYSHSVKVKKSKDDEVGRSNNVSPESGFCSRNASPLNHPNDHKILDENMDLQHNSNGAIRSNYSETKLAVKPSVMRHRSFKELQTKKLSEFNTALKPPPVTPPKSFMNSKKLSPDDSSLTGSFKKSLSIENLQPSQNHAANCNCKEKIRRLDIKFAEVRKLLRTNKISGLDDPPPSFKPPPPPSAQTKKMKTESPSSSKPLRVSSMSNLQLLQTAGSILKEQNSESAKEPDDQLCKKCAKTIAPLSETIEVLPKLLPTDALNRPQLGLSYSMEDDLSPGVKEIQTSTPKSDTVSSFRTKDLSNLSTFSQSIGSLGYVSSQSDLELSGSLTESEKVPVTSLKSQTLPMGLNLGPSPFYSDIGHQYDKSLNNKSSKDRKFEHRLSVDLELRSSSAPPVPQPEPKKKHLRGFSKKEKKKNEDNVSVKSDLSLDEGVILKKIELLDGTTSIINSVGKKDCAEEKSKRRSVWKSILRRK